jgi:HPt (histidine-containing phosphotransfer) domain-containing protein
MQVLDIRFLDRQSFGDVALRTELLALYATQLKELGEFMATCDGEPLRKAAHRLRGASLAIGAEEIAETARAIEMAELNQPQAGQRIAKAAKRFLQSYL